MLEAVVALARAVFALVYLALLVWAAYVDAQSRVIPNASVVALALWGLVGHIPFVLGFLPPFLPSLSSCVISAVAVVAVFLAFEMVWRTVNKGRHGMGMGDIKLVGAVCLAMGPWAFPCFAAACLSAVFIETLRHNRTFAFGPYLCACFAVCLIYLVVSN